MPGNYSHITRADGSILTGAIYNADHQNHITFCTPGGVDDYSTNLAQMQATVDPGESGTESLPTDLAGEILRIRNIIKEITGKTYWYESPGTSIVAGTVIDSTFRILGSSDATKKQAFESDTNITTGTTVTATSQNRNGTLALEESQLFPISASVASNALTFTLDPCVVAFRSVTLGSGTVNVRAVNSAITTVISSGSTGGTVSGESGRLLLLAIDNAGTVELAWCNNKVNLLDESTLLSTTAEGGAGAADSATVIYSTTARSNVPFRILGYIDSTQTTAGTWATAPSTIYGDGLSPLIANIKLDLQPVQVTTSGTSFSFSSIPAGVRRITVMLSEVSLSGSDELLVQIGPGGAVETSGYVSSSFYFTLSPANNVVNNTTGFVVRTSASAAAIVSGTLVLTLFDSSTNSWVASGTFKTTTTTMSIAAGSKSLAGVLNILTIKTDGANTFDAGSISVIYER